MQALPTRRLESWRYGNLAALATVWEQGEGHSRTITVAPGDTGRLDDALIGSKWHHDRVTATVQQDGRLTGVIDAGGDDVTTQHYEIILEKGASADLVVLVHGGRYGRIAIDVTLHERADFKLGGILLAGGAQTAEIVTTVRHAGPGGTSRQIVRAVAAGGGTASYLGQVAVARAGQKTDAGQSFRALLLDRGATANAKPELEIFADDVKCAHGAAIGEIDANALFYLQSRGVPLPAARALLTRAFLSDALESLDDAARDTIEARVSALMAAL
ncbi:SufD family Fe-S cluster assembly protein [Sandarakinorhabdus sp.]|uniref:SufD family Fe-S cluster assembly protein n=1 Tax=Sandarakinorhabdus sp. TaxID=1916663 RepID=UPI00286EAFB0|nr:SufD family Fe-S cluster assembly protein [Sandarakinorhabdus sp.]